LNNIGLLYLYTRDLEKSREYFTLADEEYNSSLARKNLTVLNELEAKRTLKGKEEPETQSGYSFAVVGSYENLNDANDFAKRLRDSKPMYQPEIYLAENKIYGVTLGGYLSYEEARGRAEFAREKGIAKDAYVWQSRQWGENLFTATDLHEMGWIYLGQYVNTSNRWKTTYLDIDEATPRSLEGKSIKVSTAVENLNVRDQPPNTFGSLGRIIDVLVSGDEVQVLKIEDWASVGYIWAQVSY
jgi:hypothetical protein